MAGKIYYSMGEVAEMLDVSQPLLRFWERKFDIITPHRNKKGNRMFTAEDVRNLKTIYHLTKERGMTLAGAEKYLRANRKAIERDMEIAERLQSIRALLVEIRHELGVEGEIVAEPEIVEEREVVADPRAARQRETVETAEVDMAETVTGPVAEPIAETGAESIAELFAETVESPETAKPMCVEQTLF